MKQKLLKTMLLLSALVVGSSSVWATDNPITYKFTSASWTATVGGSSANWTSGKDGAGYNNNGIQVTSTGTGANGTSPSSFENITEIVLTYNTNKSAGAGTADVQIGTNDKTSKDWAYSGSSDGRTANFTLTYSYATPQTGNVKITLNTTTNSIYLVSCKITYGGGGSTCATPTFSPSAGAVAYGTSVSISCATDDATIYYTTDGSTPTSSSTEYSSAITVNTAQTIKAIAVKDGLTGSEVASAAYTIAAPAAPTFSVAAGAVASGTAVTISGTGTIRYTTNGDNPTSSTGTVYSEPVSIDEDCTLKAICVDAGGNASSITSASYTVITPVAGYDVDFESVPVAYSDWTMTNIAQETSDISAHGGTYYGTTDGKSTASIVTTEKVANPETLTFYVSKTTKNTTSSTWYVDVSSNGSDWTNITSQDATSMSVGSWTKVECDIESGGTFYTNVYLRIRYDGSTAVRAIDDITLTEVMPVAAPTFSVSAGIYTTIKSVTITCATDGASIYYTTDGSTPTSSSTLYSSAVSISESCTLKAIAIKGEDVSNVTSATYIINLPTSYNLATTITSGKRYVIASGKNGSVKVMTSQNTSYRNQTGATVETNVLTASGACEFIIQGPDANGNFTIYDDASSGYLYASSSSSNDLKTQATVDNNARWAIIINGEGVASITAQGTNTRNVMQYNSGSPRFACYSSASQTNVYLFEKDGESTPTETVTVSDADFATYASDNALDFSSSSIKAYVASASGTTGVTFTQVSKVPANTGVLLYYDGGKTESIPTVTGTASDVSGNVFKRGAGAAVASEDGSYKNYILNKPSEKPIGFYKAAGKTVAKNRAYIHIDASAPIKEFIALPGFEDDATSIQNSKFEIQNEEAPIYNLAGQRLNKMQKGINIVNGKKIMVK